MDCGNVQALFAGIGCRMSVKRIAWACCPLYLRPISIRIANSAIGVRLVRGAFWSVVGAVTSRGLMLVATILVARMLGKTGYGELSMIQGTVGMLGGFAGFGLGLAATKYVAEFRESDPRRAGRIIGLSGLVAMLTGCLMAVGLFLFAPWLAQHTLNAPQLAGALRIGSLILFISALNGAQTGALSGFEAFKTIALVNLFIGIISFPILLIGARFGGMTGAIWALVINLCFNWLINHLALRKEARRNMVPFSVSQCSREWSVLWRFSFPVVLSGALVGPVIWICDSILVNQKNGYEALGSYSVAFQISIIISTVNMMIGGALLPILASSLKDNNKTLNFANLICPWAIGIFCAIPFICIPELWAIFFGDEYSNQKFYNTVILVAIASIIIAHKQGIARIFIVKNFLWWSLLGNSFWGIIAIICAYSLRNFGEEGRAASFVIAYALNTIVFIPFYIHMKLCPKHLITSRECNFIWLILIALATVVPILKLHLYFRLIILLASYFFIFWLFKNLWNNCKVELKEKSPYAK